MIDVYCIRENLIVAELCHTTNRFPIYAKPIPKAVFEFTTAIFSVALLLRYRLHHHATTGSLPAFAVFPLIYHFAIRFEVRE
jgi:hypothetical protein